MDDVPFGDNYRVTVSLIGDHILRVQPSGYVNLEDQIDVLRFTEQVPVQAIPDEQPYVHIEDWLDFEGASLAARRYYIEAMPKRTRIMAVIFCHVSHRFKLSVQLGKSLRVLKFPVHVVDDYADAVRLAHTLQTRENNPVCKPLIAVSEGDSSTSGQVLGGGRLCPVSSLPVTDKPQWTDIPIDDHYSVSFHVIGNRILLTAPRGRVTDEGTRRLIEEREKVLRDAGLMEKKYVEIRDHGSLTGKPSKTARMMMTNRLLEETKKGDLLGFFVFNAPLFIRWMFTVGVKLYHPPASVAAVKNYREAIENAFNVLNGTGIDTGLSEYGRFTKEDWGLEFNGYGIGFELIGDDILYSVSQGSLKESYVDRALLLHDKVIEETGLEARGYCYRILNWEKLEKTTWKARRIYIDGVKNLNRKTPCRFSVVFGLNTFMRTIISVSRQLVPVPVATAHSLEEAVAIIEREKEKARHTGTGKRKKWRQDAVPEKALQPYCDELLRYMGAINWDQEGVEGKQISDAHPFKPVFDAMAIIKEDVDDLFKARKQTEETLKREEEKYRTILENIEDGYFEVDLTGNLSFFNDALCRITGVSENELPGMNNREYMDADTARKVHETYVRIYQTGEPVKGLEYAILKNGVKKYVETSVSLMKDGGGKPIGFRGILRDVSQRKQAEEKIKEYSEHLEEMVEDRTRALRESEEKYRNILENIEDGYYEVDLAGNLTFFNEAACRITGYSEKELTGMNNRQITDEVNAAKFYREYKRVYETGMPTKRFDCEIVKKDGTAGFLEASISLINDSNDQPVGFRGIIRDVTERKELEREIEQKRRQAEEATRAKSEFLANMSHEIRTPLNGIVGMAELALDTNLDDNQKNILHTINTEAGSLQDVINEILDFSKIEAGKLILEEIPFDLRVTMEDVAQSFAFRAEQKGLDFISFLAPDVPARLIGDPARLRQILVNLTGNALKFTRKGELYLKGEIVEDREDCVKIRFSVKDTGIGIPKDRHAAIFESFTQVDGSTTRNYGGTGLGTTISKQLAERMGGEIGLESEEGLGSTFWFTALFRRQVEKRQAPALPNYELKDLRVLVADGNQTRRFVLIAYLKSWGCLPAETGEGEEALSVLKEAASFDLPFDLILMDLQMGEMSAFDLAQKIKTVDALKEIPIIVLTSAGLKGDGRDCKEIGIHGYLTKPIRQDELRKAMLSVLGSAADRETNSSPELIMKHSVAEDYRKDVQILLVDDYPTNQHVAMRHLIKAGYHVDLAEDGMQAVRAYKKKHYDLVFMDIQMPVMDGYEAAREIRRLEMRNLKRGADDLSVSPFYHLPIVAMTAHAIKGYKEKCLEAGMDDYIAKPIRRKELLALADKWTGGEDLFRVMNADCAAPRKTVECREPMAYGRALEEFEGDEEFLNKVLEGFIGNVASQTGIIRQAIFEGDAKTVQRDAHSIKGGAANLTAEALSAIAFELENIGKSEALKGGIEALEKLEKEFYRLEAYVKNRTCVRK